MAYSQPTVEYRDLPGHPGYRIGSDGSVWSCWYCVSNGQNKGTRHEMGDKWHRMKGCADGAGYIAVRIKGRGSTRVHILVLEAFIGPRPAGMVCRHFPDRNPANNRLENLSWGTNEDNQGPDREAHGTSNKGERNGRRKLSEADVREIRRRYRVLLRGMKRVPSGTLAPLAKEFGISHKYLQQLLNSNREVWVDVE